MQTKKTISREKLKYINSLELFFLVLQEYHFKISYFANGKDLVVGLINCSEKNVFVKQK